MPISPEVVRHVARLARLHVPAEDEERLCRELSRMLEYFGEIAAVPTDGVEPTSHVVPVEVMLRDDVAIAGAVAGETEDLLKLAPGAEAPFFRVPRFHGTGEG